MVVIFFLAHRLLVDYWLIMENVLHISYKRHYRSFAQCDKTETLRPRLMWHRVNQRHLNWTKWTVCAFTWGGHRGAADSEAHIYDFLKGLRSYFQTVQLHVHHSDLVNNACHWGSKGKHRSRLWVGKVFRLPVVGGKVVFTVTFIFFLLLPGKNSGRKVTFFHSPCLCLLFTIELLSLKCITTNNSNQF